MSEEELQLLVTMDDPVEAPEEDTFNHLQVKNTLEYWLGQPCQIEPPAEALGDSGAYKVTFGQGDWTCTLSRLTGTTNLPMNSTNGNVIESPNKKFDVDICRVAHWKNGEIVEQKVFYDLAGMQNQMDLM